MPTSIAVLGGTGAEGFGLALRWAQAGETVIIGSRDLARARQAAEKIQQKHPSAKISGQENSQACAAAEIVVLTVPFEAHAALLKQIKSLLIPGALVVDTTVPLAASVGGRATRTLGLWQGSAAQAAAELLPREVSLVAAFHNLPAALLAAEGPVDCDVIVCSDDPAASERVQVLATKIPGVRALDGGKLENARVLENITALLIGLNIRNKGHAGIRITNLPAAAYKSS
jgi:NADPH-dependent F420 reductase